MRRWLWHRLDVACLCLHLGELLWNVFFVQIWRHFLQVSLPVQLLSLLVQMGLTRLCVVTYFYYQSSPTMRHAPLHFRIPLLHEAMVVLQESLLGAWLLYSIFHPFSSFFTRPFEASRHSKASAVKYPVLFIHGYACNAGYWYPVLRYLSNADVAHLYTISLEPLYLDIHGFAHQVAQKAKRILDETKSEKIILVGHSMGGLVARAFMKWHGGEKCVAKLITLQTPHRGTNIAKSTLACLFCSHAVCDMQPGSRFLAELGSPEESNQGGAIPMTSMFSYHDTLISPQESSIMNAPNTRNIPFCGIGHLVMPFIPRVQKIILNELLNCG